MTVNAADAITSILAPKVTHLTWAEVVEDLNLHLKMIRSAFDVHAPKHSKSTIR